MTKTNSLLSLLREQKKKKNRPLKVVCDWDEVIQPLKPVAIYELIKLPKFKDKVSSSFSDFFKRFWETATMKGSFSSDGEIESVEGTETEKELFKEYVRMRSFRRGELSDYEKSFYSSPEWVETITSAPLLSASEELLECLKEGLIEKLVLISSYRKGRKEGQGVTRKTKNFPKTFGLFSQCELELTEVGKTPEGKYKPYRWEVMRDKWPDWDIFIDDNPNIVNETIKNVPDPDKNKIYVLPDYKNCRGVQGDNVYLFKTTVSDLKDQDFTIAALEMKVKDLEKELTTQKELIASKQSLWKQTNTYLLFASGIALPLLGLGIYHLIKKPKKPKSN